MLPFAFSDVGAMSQLEFLLQHVEERLFQLAQAQKDDAAYLEVTDYVPPEDEERRVAGRIGEDDGLSSEQFLQRVAPVTRLSSFGQLVDYVEHKLLLDRKSTRLNSSHVRISYAVFCLKKKK